MKWTMLVDITKCNGCFNCFLACKDEFYENDYPPYSAPIPRLGCDWIKVPKKERGQYPSVDVAYLPQPCMHCGEASCIEVAEDGAAYRRDDGIVLIDPEKSKGQKQIAEACPYDAVYWNEDEDIPQKCTFCVHLLEEGWDEPRCVQACPTEALIFGDADDPESRVSKLIESGDFEPIDPGHEPRILYKGLYKYNKHFIAGSVAFGDDCIEDAEVTLFESGDKVQATETNIFGDFKFDGLEAGRRYRVEIDYPGFEKDSRKVELEKSTNLGTIFLKKK